MGQEVANCHAGSGDAETIRRDLERREPDWLRDAARAVARQVQTDFEAFRHASGRAAGEHDGG